MVPTGTANIASVLAAFRRLGAAPRVGESAAEVAGASHVMLPGVGAFGASMARLVELGLDGRCAIGSCGPADDLRSASGISCCSRPATRARACRGWESFRAMSGVSRARCACRSSAGTRCRRARRASLIEDGWAYFANSYRATGAPGWTVASATHGGRYVAAMERGNVVGCQFHPELSGAYGEALLSRFLELG